MERISTKLHKTCNLCAALAFSACELVLCACRVEVGRYLDANGELIFTNLETGTAYDKCPLSPVWDGEPSS